MRRGRQRRAGVALVAAGVLSVAACSAAGPDGRERDGAAATASEISGALNVFAAASLNSVLTDLAEDFEANHPEVTVRLNFAGSSDLAAQILSGAPADVFASADPGNMDKVGASGLVAGEPVTFATNSLQIAVAAGNPHGIERLADLADDRIKTVVCAPQVPCGSAARAVSIAGGVEIPAVSEESSVTDVLGKVISGEADAGLVYVTDVQNSEAEIEGIDFPESQAVVNDYPVARIAGSANPAAASEFVELVTGSEGRRTLAEHGFGTP